MSDNSEENNKGYHSPRILSALSSIFGAVKYIFTPPEYTTPREIDSCRSHLDKGEIPVVQLPQETKQGRGR